MSFPIETTQVFRHFLNLQPTHWRRRRGSLGPQQVMLGLMTMTVLGCKGYEKTLDEMQARLGRQLGWNQDEDVPSASALCQARLKLDEHRCAALVSQVYALCSTARTCASLRYGGFRLLAEDGTKLALPAYKALRDHFGCPSQGVGRDMAGPQASLTVLWDVGANQPVAWRLGTYRTSEQEHARALAESVGTGDLLLADRNFPSRRYLTQIHGRQAHVLMRIRADGSGDLRAVTAFLASSATDVICEIETRDEHGHPLPDQRTMPVRLLRATLPDGSTAVYITTLLDQQAHPGDVLVALYAQRWRIETAFRELKIWHGLERFRARHVDGIAQEIAALMIFQLLASELEAQARQKHAEAQPPQPSEAAPHAIQKPTIRFNRRIVADCTVNIIYAAAMGEDIHKALKSAFYRIWRYRQSVKPGRTFPRERKSSHRGFKPRGSTKKGKR